MVGLVVRGTTLPGNLEPQPSWVPPARCLDTNSGDRGSPSRPRTKSRAGPGSTDGIMTAVILSPQRFGSGVVAISGDSSSFARILISGVRQPALDVTAFNAVGHSSAPTRSGPTVLHVHDATRCRDTRAGQGPVSLVQAIAETKLAAAASPGLTRDVTTSRGRVTRRLCTGPPLAR